MPSANYKRALLPLLCLSVLLSSGCATAPQPTVTLLPPPVKLAPLPSSVQEIDLTPSAHWQLKVTDYFKKRANLYDSVTAK